MTSVKQLERLVDSLTEAAAATATPTAAAAAVVADGGC